MPSAITLPATRPGALRERAETPTPIMAKARLKAEIAPYRIVLGAAIKRARFRNEWSLKELAGHVGRDERQIARWEDGSERAHWDALFAIDHYRLELLVALAEVCGDAIEIRTIVTVPRRPR